MQFKPAVLAAFIACGLATAAAAPSTTSAVNDLTPNIVSFTVSFGKGAAFVTLGGETFVYYQARDNSVRELTGSGPPDSDRSYREVIRIPGNEVRRNSPIAATIYRDDISEVRTRSFHLCQIVS